MSVKDPHVWTKFTPLNFQQLEIRKKQLSLTVMAGREQIGVTWPDDYVT